MRRSDKYDVVILGAGAAGLMCAATAGLRGRRVLLVDHADKAGKKILISGGGRCNFTNLDITPECYISDNPHFAKSALGRFGPQDFIEMVEGYGIAYHEKTLGQLFCDGSAKQVLSMLLAQCQKANVEIALGQSVTAVEHGDTYRVSFGDRKVTADSLVIATGGPSIPKMGASGFAFDLARQFGLKVVEPRPALVPFTLGEADQPFRNLAGVATEVIATAGKTSFREAVLFTHKGLSGPVILQISSYWRSGQKIHLDFLPDAKAGWLIEAKRQKPRSHIKAVLTGLLPDRLATVLAQELAIMQELANTPDKQLKHAEEKLAAWEFSPTGTEGFAKAEVTVGGVSTVELSSKTMEAKKQSGLYVIGEAVDVTGWLGGYNFQWAWASGFVAGEVC